ncbi:MAG: hypothetical protein F6K39_24385 [Okeania sp. SIO3B3]|nr:hypothetical protein [Okeania sp. SIO3B3]
MTFFTAVFICIDHSRGEWHSPSNGIRPQMAFALKWHSPSNGSPSNGIRPQMAFALKWHSPSNGIRPHWI